MFDYLRSPASIPLLFVVCFVFVPCYVVHKYDIYLAHWKLDKKGHIRLFIAWAILSGILIFNYGQLSGRYEPPALDPASGSFSRAETFATVRPTSPPDTRPIPAPDTDPTPAPDTDPVPAPDAPLPEPKPAPNTPQPKPAPDAPLPDPKPAPDAPLPKDKRRLQHS